MHVEHTWSDIFYVNFSPPMSMHFKIVFVQNNHYTPPDSLREQLSMN